MKEMDDLKNERRQKEIPLFAKELLILIGKYGEAFVNMKVVIEILVTIGSSIA